MWSLNEFHHAPSARLALARHFSMHYFLAGEFLNFWYGWRMRANFFKEEVAELKMQTQSVPSSIISHCVQSKGIHPRHPPREFPLGLRAPVLGSRLFAKGLKWEEMSRSVSRASWGEEVSSPRVGTTLSDYRECSALAIPTLRFSILCLVCSFRFRFLDCNSGQALVL